MVEQVGAGTAAPTTQTPFSDGRWAPSGLVMKPSFVIQSDAYVPGSRFKDPITAVKDHLNNIFGSPAVSLAVMGGAAGLLTLIGIKSHKTLQAHQLTRALERRFEAFDLLLDPASGKSADEIRRIYHSGVHTTLEKYRQVAHIKALPVGKSISADAIQTLHIQERSIQHLVKEMESSPTNAAGIGQLLKKLEDNKRLEISANIILGRLAAIATEARSVRPGSTQWQALRDQKRYVEMLCEKIEPSRSHLPAHQDLAKRYVESQVSLLQHMQSLPRLGQKDLRSQLQEFYGRRQLNLSHYLPPDSSFFRAIGLMPSEAKHLQVQLASIQNARYRTGRETVGIRSLRRQEKAASNEFLTSMEKLYLRISESTTMPLTPSAFRKSGRPRS